MTPVSMLQLHQGQKDGGEMLLPHQNAYFNGPSENYGSTLALAPYKGQEQIVKLLRDDGADTNARVGGHESAAGGFNSKL